MGHTCPVFRTAHVVVISFFTAACVSSAAAGSTTQPSRTNADRPALATVPLRVPASSAVATTAVVRRGGNLWFAVAVNRELRIFRWQSVRWVLDGQVELPEAIAPPGVPGSELRSTSLTGGAAPDFTAHAYGADTLWYALVARLRGRWRVVPFDDQFKRRDPFTFAYGAEKHLVHGIYDSCGCASGPTTEQWYRFADGVFVATDPPGSPAVCSATALASAGHWEPLPYDPLVRHVDQPFRPVRFACAHGWALATDGHKVSVYEQHGARLDDPVGHRWLRVGVGSPHLVGTDTDFALPRSLLNRLAQKIGVEIPAAKTGPSPSPPLRYTPWQRAPISIRISPGDTYEATDLFDGRPKVLTVKVQSRQSGTRLSNFRWQNRRWAPVK